MAISDLDKVDGCGISPDGKMLVMLISDHMTWDDEGAHLQMLQNKINSYLNFCENGQYAEYYPDANFDGVIIEIHFLYDINKKVEDFLNAVQHQLGQYGVLIKAYIDSE